MTSENLPFFKKGSLGLSLIFSESILNRLEMNALEEYPIDRD